MSQEELWDGMPVPVVSCEEDTPTFAKHDREDHEYWRERRIQRQIDDGLLTREDAKRGFLCTGCRHERYCTLAYDGYNLRPLNGLDEFCLADK